MRRDEAALHKKSASRGQRIASTDQPGPAGSQEGRQPLLRWSGRVSQRILPPFPEGRAALASPTCRLRTTPLPMLKTSCAKPPQPTPERAGRESEKKTVALPERKGTSLLSQVAASVGGRSSTSAAKGAQPPSSGRRAPSVTPASSAKRNARPRVLDATRSASPAPGFVQLPAQPARPRGYEPRPRAPHQLAPASATRIVANVASASASLSRKPRSARTANSTPPVR